MNSFFDILTDILTKKSGGNLHEEPEFNKLFTSYMIVRYLSMKDDLIVYARIINKYQSVLDSEQIYKWLYKNVPKQSNKYIKYIKQPKKKVKNN